MKAAVLSDIHGNQIALDVVLQDIDRYNILTEKPIEAYWCLGDTVGYGPKPRECLEKIRELTSVNILGNHEDYVIQLYNWNLKEHGQDYPFRVFGIAGEGAVEGVHLSLRRIYGDNTAIGQDRAEHTRKLVTNMACPDYAARTAQEFAELIERAKPKKPKKHRSRAEELQEELADPNTQRLLDRHQERLKQKEQGDSLMDYLRKLPITCTIPTDQGDVLLVHDNPFAPAAERADDSELENLVPRDCWPREWYYLFDSAMAGHNTYAEPKPLERNGSLIKPQKTFINQVFAHWDELWPNVKFILFGHSHYEGVYTQNGRHLCNAGTVGMPRPPNRCLATYAILDTEAAIPFHIRRVEFDYQTVSEQMKQAGLPNKYRPYLRSA